MSEKRYTEEEVAAIFERAAKTEHAALPAPEESNGMTLAALQDIGREVGISPESIALAARAMDQSGRPASRTFLGLPIGVGRTVELDRPISDADWERLVADLRDTFSARGAVRYDGPFRQWTNGNLQALVEPTANGHRVRLRTLKGDSRTLMAGGMAMLGFATATLIAVVVAGGGIDHASTTGIGILTVLGLGIFGAGALQLPSWARRRRAQIEQVLARLALAEPATQETLNRGEESQGQV
jgi:hypothetical protein